MRSIFHLPNGQISLRGHQPCNDTPDANARGFLRDAGVAGRIKCRNGGAAASVCLQRQRGCTKRGNFEEFAAKGKKGECAEAFAVKIGRK